MKDNMFADGIYLGSKILQDRAQEIRAEWSYSEDLALLQSRELRLRTDDEEQLAGL